MVLPFRPRPNGILIQESRAVVVTPMVKFHAQSNYLVYIQPVTIKRTSVADSEIGTMEMELRQRGRTLLTAVALAVSGFFVGALVIFLTSQGLIFVGIDVMNSPAVQLVVSTVVLRGVTLWLLAISYLKLSGLGFDFLALCRPTMRDVGWIVGGLLAFSSFMVDEPRYLGTWSPRCGESSGTDGCPKS